MLPPPREDNTLPLPTGGRRPPTAPVTGPVRYRLLEEIAHGGMGAVYRARDPEMDRMLALKVLREEHHDNPEMLRRFLEEARIAGQLQHPGIVPIHDIGRLADQRPYFTMKLVEGRTLSAHLRERKEPRDDVARFLGIFEQVCQAIAYAHSRGVIHRDVKPANVMVGAFGEVQVMDWGLAKVLTCREDAGRSADDSSLPINGHPDQTQAGSIVGTPAYMAPEQARCQAIDERVDVFGLGGVLCEILTGQPTYVLPRSMATWLLDKDRDLSEAHRRLDASGADAELIALAHECLAEAPADRPRDAAVVATRITAYRAGVEERLRRAEVERVAAEARADAARARARAGRLRTLLALGCLGVVVLAAALALYLRDRQLSARQRAGMLLAQADALSVAAADLQGNEQALAKWRDAFASIEQAREALDGCWGVAALRHRVDESGREINRELLQLRRDREFLDRLAEIRLQKDDDYEVVDTDGRYLDAFRDYGLDVQGRPAAELAQTVRARPPAVVREVVSALDDWTAERRRARLPETRWRPLLSLASAIDDNAWRNGLRNRLIGSPAGRWDTPLVAIDLPAHLATPGGLAPLLLASGLESARRRELLLQHAKKADLTQLSATSVQLLASLLRADGEFGEAIRLLREAQRQHPTDVWLNHDLASALLQQPARQVDEAIRYYTAARAIRPEVGHALAHALEARGNHEEAVRVFEQLVHLKPNNAKHLNCLGAAYERLKRYDDAARVFRRAIELDPKGVNARYNLGLVYGRLNRTDLAERYFLEALRLDPNEAQARYDLVGLYLFTKRLSDAEKLLIPMLEKDPSDLRALFNLALVREAQDRADDAVRLLRRLLTLAPTHAKSHANLALLLTQQNDLEAAEKHLRLALQTDPNLPQARLQLGRLLFNQHRYQESLSELRWAAKLNSSDVWGHILLGIALEKTGLIDECVRTHQEAMKRFPDNAVLPYNLANLLAGHGRRTESLENFRRAITIDPEYAEAHCNLGVNLREAGEFREGLEYVKRGHELGQKRKNWPYPSSAWVADLEALVAVEPKLAGLLDGSRRPAGVEELLDAARACAFKRLPAGQVRLLLRVPLRTVDREQAAIAAALAGTGQGKDASSLTAVDRLEMRLRALTWLRAELASLAVAARSPAPAVAVRAQSILRNWQRDSRLAAVRESPLTARMAEEERGAWERFWRAVRDLAPLRAD